MLVSVIKCATAIHIFFLVEFL